MKVWIEKDSKITIILPAPSRSGQVFIIRREDFSLNQDWSDINFDPCQHEWKTYIGFKEEYDYCTKCDKKAYS